VIGVQMREDNPADATGLDPAPAELRPDLVLFPELEPRQRQEGMPARMVAGLGRPPSERDPQDAWLIEKIKEIVTTWLNGMGLELKPSKTRITHTLRCHDGIARSTKTRVDAQDETFVFHRSLFSLSS